MFNYHLKDTDSIAYIIGKTSILESVLKNVDHNDYINPCVINNYYIEIKNITDILNQIKAALTIGSNLIILENVISLLSITDKQELYKMLLDIINNSAGSGVKTLVHFIICENEILGIDGFR